MPALVPAFGGTHASDKNIYVCHVFSILLTTRCLLIMFRYVSDTCRIKSMPTVAGRGQPIYILSLLGDLLPCAPQACFSERRTSAPLDISAERCCSYVSQRNRAGFWCAGEEVYQPRDSARTSLRETEQASGSQGRSPGKERIDGSCLFSRRVATKC